jgi:transcriptional regulator with XRE-family HTH domain
MPVIPSRLLERRLYWGLTQQDVAKALGIKNYQQYAQWETGEVEPGGTKIEMLSKALRCSADYLLGLVEQPNDVFSEENLTDYEKKMLYYFRNGQFIEAAQYALSGGAVTPALKSDDMPPLIESGKKSDSPGSEPAA